MSEGFSTTREIFTLARGDVSPSCASQEHEGIYINIKIHITLSLSDLHTYRIVLTRSFRGRLSLKAIVMASIYLASAQFALKASSVG